MSQCMKQLYQLQIEGPKIEYKQCDLSLNKNYISFMEALQTQFKHNF